MIVLRLLLVTALLCAQSTPGSDRESPSHLRNFCEVGDGILSGGEPHDAQSFHELAALGVETIVSVDGALPNVAAARAAGLRYVHIPLGYDGIDQHAQLSLAQVGKSAERPLYVHCHHGKHRGPAAAAIVALSCQTLDKPQAIELLRQAGTSKDYGGLWQAIENYKRPDPGTPLPKLVEQAKVSSLATAMVQIDRAYADLQLCATAGWKAPREHPDLAPHQLAVLIREGLRESHRHLPKKTDPALIEQFSEAESVALSLQEALAEADAKTASRTFQAVGEACTQCHVRFRN